MFNRPDQLLIPLLLLSTASVCYGSARRHYHHRHQPLVNSPLTAYFNESDGYNLLWSKSANSRTQLREEKAGNYSVIRGDVILGENNVPAMAYAPHKEERISLRFWIKELSVEQRKVIKLQFYKDNAVKPALKYVSALRESLEMPIVIHGDLVMGPYGQRASTQPLEAKNFLNYIEDYVPQGILSASWLTDVPLRDEQHIPSYTWREILDMLEFTYEFRQPIIYNFRALFIDKSFDQIMFLMGISPLYSISIVSAEYPQDDVTRVEKCLTMVRLRKWAPAGRVFYDLQPLTERSYLNEQFGQLSYGAEGLKPTAFNKADWRVVQFVNPESVLSTIITSDRGLAFVGWPVAFLISERPALAAQRQSVSGTVLFVPKLSGTEDPTEAAGLTFFLLNRIDDISSSLLRGGIRLFIGVDGGISLLNRLPNSQGNQPTQSHARVARHNCYTFNIQLDPTSVSLTVYPSRDCTGANETLPTVGFYRRISLSLPVRQSGYDQSTFVIAQKSGDAHVDLIVEDLQHRSGGVVLKAGLLLLLTSLFALL